jgi:hypothetical protein
MNETFGQFCFSPEQNFINEHFLFSFSLVKFHLVQDQKLSVTNGIAAASFLSFSFPQGDQIGLLFTNWATFGGSL